MPPTSRPVESEINSVLPPATYATLPSVSKTTLLPVADAPLHSASYLTLPADSHTTSHQLYLPPGQPLGEPVDCKKITLIGD